MRFLLKCVFWLGGVFLLMPGLTGKQTTTPQVHQSQSHVPTSDTKASPDLIEQWLQAGKTLQEITTFCERNPALCVAGKAATQQIGEQSLIRAKDAYDALTNPPVAKPAEQAAVAAPASVPIPTPKPVLAQRP